MKSLVELGRELAQMRQTRGMTQKELATLSGMGQSTLARFETGGVAEFGSRKLLRLLEVLGFEMNYVPMQGNFSVVDALAELQRSLNGDRSVLQ